MFSFNSINVIIYCSNSNKLYVLSSLHYLMGVCMRMCFQSIHNFMLFYPYLCSSVFIIVVMLFLILQFNFVFKYGWCCIYKCSCFIKINHLLHLTHPKPPAKKTSNKIFWIYLYIYFWNIIPCPKLLRQKSVCVFLSLLLDVHYLQSGSFFTCRKYIYIYIPII